ncbi:MAG: FAD-binding monooxygenase protein [Puniceicoccaceae bacterium 5H]|nr:MAG: FAD-binding monooxygenase protein [Puniceicoccaceae bacterium 5H]
MKLKGADVLVAGAGPVGMFMALRLAQEGLSVRVVESAAAPASHSYALALHPESLELLDQLGLAAPVLASATRVSRLMLHASGEHTAMIDLSQLDRRYPFLAIIQQDVLERHLVAALQDRHIEVLWNHRLARFQQDSDGVDVQVDRLSQYGTGYALAHLERMVQDTYDGRFGFLIGADGNHSLVRLQSRVDFPASSPSQHYAVFEFQSRCAPSDQAHLVLDDRTTNVLWPLPGGLQRWSWQLQEFEASVYSREKDHELVEIGSGRFPKFEHDLLLRLIRERAPWFEAGSVGYIRWSIAVRFEKRLASRFGQDRVWLVGDAAHLTLPAGIQSMNVGFREAEHLACLLTDAARRHQLEALEDYNKSFTDEWRQLQGLDAGLEAGPKTPPWIADLADRLLPSLPASGRDLRALAAQLGLQAPALAAGAAPA